MTSKSHLGLQCSYNIGALQHHYHYDCCTSSFLEDVSEEEDALATCLHVYDVDIKDGECYMLNLPQPRLPTPTVFDGTTTPTFPEWARELRARLNISQFEHIDRLGLRLRCGGAAYNRHQGSADTSTTTRRDCTSHSSTSGPHR